MIHSPITTARYVEAPLPAHLRGPALMAMAPMTTTVVNTQYQENGMPTYAQYAEGGIVNSMQDLSSPRSGFTPYTSVQVNGMTVTSISNSLGGGTVRSTQNIGTDLPAYTVIDNKTGDRAFLNFPFGAESQTEGA